MAMYRPHRSGFGESMALAIEVTDSVALAKRLSTQLDRYVGVAMVTTAAEGQDPRNGWNTHMVMVSGHAVGYMNCGLPDLQSSTVPVA